MSSCSPPPRRICGEWLSGYVHRHQDPRSEPPRRLIAKRNPQKQPSKSAITKNHRIQGVAYTKPARKDFLMTDFFNNIGRKRASNFLDLDDPSGVRDYHHHYLIAAIRYQHLRVTNVPLPDMTSRRWPAPADPCCQRACASSSRTIFLTCSAVIGFSAVPKCCPSASLMSV